MLDIDPIQKHLFLEGIFLKHGYDFRQYAEASLNRRLSSLIEKHNPKDLLEILSRVLQEPEFFQEILPFMTIGTTDFFRDPLFFRSLRENVFPVLKTYSRLTLWIAGCSTGEEVLSLAILLKEENLLQNTTLYATDINPQALKTARSGIYEISAIKNFQKNYVEAGGRQSPSDYFTADYGLARFDPKLLENVVFSEHNLIADAPFIEAHLVTCRNVLIYFNRELQDRAFDLFAKSLIYKGYLGIGSKETLRFAKNHTLFDEMDTGQRIYNLKSRIMNENFMMGMGLKHAF